MPAQLLCSLQFFASHVSGRSHTKLLSHLADAPALDDAGSKSVPRLASNQRARPMLLASTDTPVRAPDMFFGAQVSLAGKIGRDDLINGSALSCFEF